MAKQKVLINNIICSLSKIDSDNLKLLQASLPDKEKSKEDYTDLDKEAISNYNNFLNLIVEKNKGRVIIIDDFLQKIDN